MNIEDTYKAHVAPQAKQQRSHMLHLEVCKLLLISNHPTSNQRIQITHKRARTKDLVSVAIHMPIVNATISLSRSDPPIGHQKAMLKLLLQKSEKILSY